jgi:hypothetical protein
MIQANSTETLLDIQWLASFWFSSTKFINQIKVWMECEISKITHNSTATLQCAVGAILQLKAQENHISWKFCKIECTKLTPISA